MRIGPKSIIASPCYLSPVIFFIPQMKNINAAAIIAEKERPLPVPLMSEIIPKISPKASPAIRTARE